MVSATRRALGVVLSGLALCVMSGPAAAQFAVDPTDASTQFQVEHYEPAPIQGLNLLGVTTSRLLPHLMPSFGVAVHYAHNPLVLVRESDRDKVETALIADQVVGEFWAALGVVDYLNFAIAMPVVFMQSGDDFDLQQFGAPAGTQIEGATTGDLRFRTKFTAMNWQDFGGFGLALVVEAWFPTGDADTFRSDGAVRFEPRLVLDFRLPNGFHLAGNVAYQLRPKRRANNLVSDDVLRWGVAVAIPTVKEMQILLSVFGQSSFNDDFDPYDPTQALDTSSTSPMDALAGFQFQLPAELVLSIGGGLGLNRSVGSAEYRAFLNFGYSPSASDVDRDGIRDADDKCPEDPEDKDDYQDDDGCPEPDNDGDGILDKSDKCPNTPEDLDSFEDEDGCPEDDNDKDGLKDVEDKCPNEPEDKDGFEDEDGCPDDDNDGDGIKDKLDSCPNEPETVNGYKDADGCPDEKPKPKEPPKPKKVVVTKTKIEIKDKVYFKTGKATIKAVSFGLLNEVAQVVNEHPQITKIQVEGHTDSKGRAKYNKKLSQARAESVMTFLIEAGVKAERLVAMGYGEDKPIESNKTNAGRAANRRVEFTILEVDGKPVGPGPVMIEKKGK